jgi:hypothetical protein
MGTIKRSFCEWTCAISFATIASLSSSQSSANAQTGSARDGSPDAAIAQKTTSAPPLQIAGYWSGTIQDPEQGIGNLNLFFTQTSSKKERDLDHYLPERT